MTTTNVTLLGDGLTDLKRELLRSHMPSNLSTETGEKLWALSVKGVDVSPERDYFDVSNEIEATMLALAELVTLAFWDGQAWEENNNR